MARCEARCNGRCNAAGMCGVDQHDEAKQYCECYDGYYCDDDHPVLRDGLCYAVGDEGALELRPDEVLHGRRGMICGVCRLPNEDGGVQWCESVPEWMPMSFM